MRLALAYKNFAANKNVSHIGLGVAAINTSKSLRAAGVLTDVWPIVNSTDLGARLSADPRITHVVISAPWIPTMELATLAQQYPDVEFAINCHSNVGFLMADANGCRLLREAMSLEKGTHNVHVAGNSGKFAVWLRDTYGSPCAWLPNLYYLDAHARAHKPLYRGGVLRVGAFGATRPLKNFLSAVAAALEISYQLAEPVEIYLSGGRTEGGGGILQAARELLTGLPNAKLIENAWQDWPGFVRMTGHMHLLLQPSYTESFNMVTADGISQGVPSVVSPAIDWAPRHWQANPDDVFELARTGRSLLTDPHASTDGLAALRAHNTAGLAAWRQYLGA